MEWETDQVMRRIRPLLPGLRSTYFAHWVAACAGAVVSRVANGIIMAVFPIFFVAMYRIVGDGFPAWIQMAAGAFFGLVYFGIYASAFERGLRDLQPALPFITGSRPARYAMSVLTFIPLSYGAYLLAGILFPEPSLHSEQVWRWAGLMACVFVLGVVSALGNAAEQNYASRLTRQVLAPLLEKTGYTVRTPGEPDDSVARMLFSRSESGAIQVKVSLSLELEADGFSVQLYQLTVHETVSTPGRIEKNVPFKGLLIQVPYAGMDADAAAGRWKAIVDELPEARRPGLVKGRVTVDGTHAFIAIDNGIFPPVGRTPPAAWEEGWIENALHLVHRLTEFQSALR